jgi:hypothetical protein
MVATEIVAMGSVALRFIEDQLAVRELDTEEAPPGRARATTQVRCWPPSAQAFRSEALTCPRDTGASRSRASIAPALGSDRLCASNEASRPRGYVPG